MKHPPRKRHFEIAILTFFILCIASVGLLPRYPNIAEVMFIISMVVFSIFFVLGLGSCLSCGDFFAGTPTTCSRCRKFYEDQEKGK